MRCKRLKRFTSTGLLVLMLCTTLFSSTAFASETGVDGDLSLAEGAQEYIPTAEDIALEAEKTAEMEAYFAELKENNAGISLAATNTWYYLSSSFPLNKQETSYYCGPATVREVVRYHNGSASSQSTYASSLGTTTSGTDMTKIAPVLKSETGKNYVYADIVSQTRWETRIMNNINNTNMAVVMDIATDTSFWKYSTSGHFLPIYGYYGTTDDVVKVEMADPHPTYCSRYVVTADNAYKANSNHWRQAMIW